MKRVTLWLFAALVASGNVNPCSAGSKVTLLSDEKNPKIAFAMQELQGALADRGHTVSHESLAQVGKGGTGIFIVLATQADTAMIDAISLSKNLKSEGFSIRKTSGRNRVVYWVVGRDAAGAMYGGLELAEVIRCEDLEGIQAIDQNPYMALRGIKFNCPLDERTPTYSNHNGDSPNAKTSSSCGTWTSGRPISMTWRASVIITYPCGIFIPSHPWCACLAMRRWPWMMSKASRRR